MDNTTSPLQDNTEKVVLELYVSGMSIRSMEAIKNIKQICEEHLANAYSLEVFDIYKNPELAAEHHIVFSPSLVKRLPLPKTVLIGNLSDTQVVLKALGINSKTY